MKRKHINVMDIVNAAERYAERADRIEDWDGEVQVEADDSLFTCIISTSSDITLDENGHMTDYTCKLRELEVIMNDDFILNLTPII